MISDLLLGLLAGVTAATAVVVEVLTFVRDGRSDRARRPGRLILF